MLENIVTTLDESHDYYEYTFVGLGVVSIVDSFGSFGQHSSKNYNKIILCLKNKISIALLISHIYLYTRKNFNNFNNAIG